VIVMRRLVAAATVMFAALGPARADILIGMAGPMTGPSAWFGEQMERGAAQAVADLNAAGGVLGQQVQLITADDFCDPEQAVAAARKLVSDRVIFVAGHFCSGASIAASEIYAAAGVLQIAPVDGLKQRQSSSGSERQVLSRRATPCTLMVPFRSGRRRPRKLARRISRK
jgi:ABC-type branched-subunit amino acid transport system substrate-binding protein